MTDVGHGAVLAPDADLKENPHMRLRRALIGVLVTLMATIGVTAIASPASAAPGLCGARATIRMEWTGTDGATHYDVPPSSQRAWSAWDTADGDWTKGNIKNLYVRACLTNTNSEGHHCGSKY
jgi:hypothetical protein